MKSSKTIAWFLFRFYMEGQKVRGPFRLKQEGIKKYDIILKYIPEEQLQVSGFDSGQQPGKTVCEILFSKKIGQKNLDLFNRVAEGQFVHLSTLGEIKYSYSKDLVSDELSAFSRPFR